MTKKPYFYDKDLKKVSCYSYVEFIKTLTELQTNNRIDYLKTIAAPAYCIIHKDGTSMHYHNWYNLFPVMEEEYGIELIVNQSQVNMQCFHMFLRSPVLKFEEAPIAEEVVEVMEVVEEEVPLVEVSLIEEESAQDVDWEKVWSLKDDTAKAASKDALIKYAMDNFGVELRKNQKFEKMVDGLKEALTK